MSKDELKQKILECLGKHENQWLSAGSIKADAYCRRSEDREPFKKALTELWDAGEVIAGDNKKPRHRRHILDFYFKLDSRKA